MKPHFRSFFFFPWLKASYNKNLDFVGFICEQVKSLDLKYNMTKLSLSELGSLDS